MNQLVRVTTKNVFNSSQSFQEGVPEISCSQEQKTQYHDIAGKEA